MGKSTRDGEGAGFRETIEKQAKDEHEWREKRRQAVGVDPLTGKQKVPTLEEVKRQVVNDWKRHGD